MKNCRNRTEARARGWSCLMALGLVAVSCGGEAAKTVVGSVDSWEIETSAPQVSGAQVSASFTARGDGMRAYGACLLADLHGGKSCQTEADCATGAVVTLADGHSLYCVAPAGESQKICWTRNGADAAWCNKVPPPGRIAGTNTTPLVEAAQLSGSGKTTRWMALSCLNASTFPGFADGPRPPCASSDEAAAAYRAYSPSATTTFTAP